MKHSGHPHVPVEICIDASSKLAAARSATAAFRGGADRVEVCSDMSVDGLTPPSASVAEARRVFGTRPGVLVMIRPRPGDFVYSPTELELMQRDIEMAAEAGADGVVFGVLEGRDHRLAGSALRTLVGLATSYGLETTFHRAFDAAAHRLEVLDTLIDCGVARVLTAGIPWGADGSALDGIDVLDTLIRRAAGRLELTIGGGLGPSNVRTLLEHVLPSGGRIAVHSYSGVLSKGSTSLARVRDFVSAVSELTHRTTETPEPQRSREGRSHE